MLAVILIFSLSSISFSQTSSQQKRTYYYSIFSDKNINVSGPDVSGVVNAVPSYADSGKATINGASWLWDTYYVSNPSVQQTCWFSFYAPVHGNIQSAVLHSGADDYHYVYVNGNLMCSYSSYTGSSAVACDLTAKFITGFNLIEIQCINAGYSGSTSTGNPGGAIFELIITGWTY